MTTDVDQAKGQAPAEQHDSWLTDVVLIVVLTVLGFLGGVAQIILEYG